MKLNAMCAVLQKIQNNCGGFTCRKLSRARSEFERTFGVRATQQWIDGGILHIEEGMLGEEYVELAERERAEGLVKEWFDAQEGVFVRGFPNPKSVTIEQNSAIAVKGAEKLFKTEAVAIVCNAIAADLARNNFPSDESVVLGMDPMILQDRM